MSTYVSALVDYIINFFSLSFNAYSPMALEEFTANLPEAAKALPAEDIAELHDSAIGPWGSLAGFTEGLPASVSALEDSEGVTAAIYDEDVNSAGNQHGQRSTGLGGLLLHHSLDCSWRAFPNGVLCVSLS
jgi:hypothetical protein